MSMLRELELLFWSQYDGDEILETRPLKNLKLGLNGFTYYQIEPHIQQLLTNNFSVEYLRVLSVELNEVNINNICQMKSIKTLEIELHPPKDDDNYNCYLIKLVQNLPNLERLTIHDEYLFENSVVPTTKLIVKILENANQLSELFFRITHSDITPFNKNDYNACLKIIKRRINHEKIKIKIRIIKCMYGAPSTEYMCMNMESDWLIFEYFFAQV